MEQIWNGGQIVPNAGGKVPVSDEAIDRVGALLEQLGVRFELVLEAVSGFGGRLDALREEIFGQFTEVGRQIRFLSEQIAENRDAIAGVRSDLDAPIATTGIAALVGPS